MIALIIKADAPVPWLHLSLESVYFAIQLAGANGRDFAPRGYTANVNTSSLLARAGLSHLLLDSDDDSKQAEAWLGYPSDGSIVWPVSEYMPPQYLLGDLELIPVVPDRVLPPSQMIYGGAREFEYGPYGGPVRS